MFVFVFIAPCCVGSLRFYILRHGETNHNAAGIIQGSSDVSVLSLTGEAQARAVGVALSRLDGVDRIERVLCSPLKRARETLALVRESVPLPAEVTVDRLREIDLHSWEGRKKAELKAAHPVAYAAWQSDPLAFEVDGRRPICDLWSRAKDAWDDDIGTDGGTGATLLVCHSACGQALLSTACAADVDPRHFRKVEFPNCGLVELDWPADAPRATRWRWRLPTEGAWRETIE